MKKKKLLKFIRSIINSPKLIVISAVLSATIATSIAIGSSMAFFTDSKESETIFTAGNVYIELSEAAVSADPNGNLVVDNSADRIYGSEINPGSEPVVHNYGYVFPGQTIHKDPTIKNIGSGDAWVAAKIIIEDGAGDIHRLFCYSDDNDNIDIECLLTGGLFDEQVYVDNWNGIEDVVYNDNYVMIQHSSHADGVYEFYILMRRPMSENEEVVLFDTLFIDSMFGNAEMQEFRELKLTVQAFAVQTFSFADCYEAMTTVFVDHFANAR